MTVTAIYQALGVDQSLASQQLAILRKAEVVQTQREGKCIYYSIHYERLKEIHEHASKLLQFS